MIECTERRRTDQAEERISEAEIYRSEIYASKRTNNQKWRKLRTILGKQTNIQVIWFQNKLIIPKG